MKVSKTVRTVLFAAAVAILGTALAGCGTGPGRVPADLGVPVPLFGAWFSYDDSYGGGTSTIAMTETEENGAVAMHFEGFLSATLQYSFVAFGIELDERSMELFQSATALSFMVRGDGQRYVIQLLSGNVTDYGHFLSAFQTVAGQAVRITIPLAHFFQPGWARPVGRFNPRNLTGMQWSIHDEIRPGAYALSVWDFRVYVPEGTEIPPVITD